MNQPPSPPLRVLVADDHELTRFSLKLQLSQLNGLDLVGLAKDGLEAIELFKRHRPDVLIMDLQMPKLDGLSASNEIKAIAPNAKIIAYSSQDNPQAELPSQSAAIDAFCGKDTPTQTLVNLIEEIGRPLECEF